MFKILVRQPLISQEHAETAEQKKIETHDTQRYKPRMHPLYQRANTLTESIIGAAIEVHRDKGPGLLEPIYEWCLVKELQLRKLRTHTQKVVQIEYKGFIRDESLRFDVLVEECVLVEAKAVEHVLPIHKAQLLSYMKLLNVPVGLLINFHELQLVKGVHRLLLAGAAGDGT